MKNIKEAHFSEVVHLATWLAFRRFASLEGNGKHRGNFFFGVSRVGKFTFFYYVGTLLCLVLFSTHLGRVPTPELGVHVEEIN